MFDVSFSEIAVIGVVALVVLGPERLPKVARTAGHLFGRLQRYVATVKADISREIELSELSKVKEEVQQAAQAFEETLQQHTRAIEAESRSLQQATELALKDTAHPIPAAVVTVAAPTVEVAAVTPIKPASPPINAPTIANAKLGSFDFGVEPPRIRVRP
ncbi:MAG: twin-arginine translocase subunit TatB [Betaproteobacteria bacterium]|nr:twin-arginine translocase subunit TatB [Betaproteobacteria bacterium]